MKHLTIGKRVFIAYKLLFRQRHFFTFFSNKIKISFKFEPIVGKL